VKVHWNASGTYDEDRLQSIFSRFGPVDFVVCSAKKHAATVMFCDTASALAAVRHVGNIGDATSPLDVRSIESKHTQPELHHPPTLHVQQQQPAVVEKVPRSSDSLKSYESGVLGMLLKAAAAKKAAASQTQP